MQTVDGLEDALLAQTEHVKMAWECAEREWERAEQATERVQQATEHAQQATEGAQQAIEWAEIAQNDGAWWRNVYYQVRVAHEMHWPIEPTLYLTALGKLQAALTSGRFG